MVVWGVCVNIVFLSILWVAEGRLSNLVIGIRTFTYGRPGGSQKIERGISRLCGHKPPLDLAKIWWATLTSFATPILVRIGWSF